MSTSPEMPSIRRRAIPGLATAPSPPPPPAVPDADVANEPRQPRLPRTERRPAADYGSTRLVNFRLPIDLHDRYKALVREAEARHPRLRHPSLTELLIGLLEEAPADADGVAELIRRKRAAEHGLEG